MYGASYVSRSHFVRFKEPPNLDYSYPCSSRRRELMPSDIKGGKTIVYFTLIFVIRFLSAIVEKPM